MYGNKTFALQCNITLSSTQKLLGVNLERKRPGDQDSSVIALFPATSGTNVTYGDSALASRSIGEIRTSGTTTAISLTFNETQCNDTAQYKWVISYRWNVYYTVERTSNVSVTAKGSFSGSSDYGINISPGIDVKEDTTITVKCKADIGNNPKGVLAIYYVLPGGSLHQFHPYSLTTGHPKPTSTCSFEQEAEIYLPMRRNWNGMVFRCVLQQTILTELGDEHRQSSSINVTYPPSNVMITAKSGHNRSHIFIEGETITLYCSSDANPTPAYNWQLPNGSFASGAIFVINKLLKSDAGNYICNAKNGVPDVYNVVQVSFTIRVEIPSVTGTPTTVAMSTLAKTSLTSLVVSKTTTRPLTKSTSKRTTGTHKTVDPAIIGR